MQLIILKKIFLKFFFVFGKTMGNLRKIISVKLINNAKDYVKCISKPSFVSQKAFMNKMMNKLQKQKE